MRDVYHCTPAQLGDQNAARVLLDMDIMFACHEAACEKHDADERMAKLKSKL